MKILARRQDAAVPKCLLALLLVGLPTFLRAQSEIKIGEVDPLTGGVSQFGIGCHQGFVLAFEEINHVGGILGQKLELVTEDDQSKPGRVRLRCGNSSRRIRSLRYWETRPHRQRWKPPQSRRATKFP